MIKEEVIIHKLNISRLSQAVHFQIALPNDAERIIGIETGAFRKRSGASSSDMLAYNGGEGTFSEYEYDGSVVEETLFTVNKIETIGRLTLYSPATTDVFFQEEVRQGHPSPTYADFTQYITNVFGQWSHGHKRYEAGVSVKNCSNVIEGYYKDSWGIFYNYHVMYELNIYIWIEKK